jgi:hypothetical protein
MQHCVRVTLSIAAGACSHACYLLLPRGLTQVLGGVTEEPSLADQLVHPWCLGAWVSSVTGEYALVLTHLLTRGLCTCTGFFAVPRLRFSADAQALTATPGPAAPTVVPANRGPAWAG